MATTTHINPEQLHSSPAFTWAVRVPAGADLLFLGGQNGVGPDGMIVGPGMLDQTRQALANVKACVDTAGADITDVVEWTIFWADSADSSEGGGVQDGVQAFGEFWPREAAPPAISVVKVLDVGPPGALVEIEAVVAIPGE